jgi:superfamily II DNA or RNA helicase
VAADAHLADAGGGAVKLRPYQSDAINAIIGRFQAGDKSTLLVLPTGCGKTVCFAGLIQRIGEWAPGKRTMVIAHREELIRQAADKIQAITGVHADIEMAGERADISMFHTAQVVVASKDTLRGDRLKRFKPEQFGLIVTDEAHHAVADTYLNVYSHFKDVPHLGVTATPDRFDEEKLGKVYQSVAFDYELPDAIRDGWLCPIRQRSVEVSGLDYSNVRTTAGELNGRDLAEVLSNEQVLQQQADATVGEARGRKALVFATPGFKTEGELSFRVSERLTEIFNRHKPGSARLVTGETPKDERHQTLRDYRDGHFQILVNVGVFTEGFDDPSIELVVMARATKSRALYAQIVGRGTRPLPGLVDRLETADERRAAIQASAKPFCEVLDFEGNAGNHKLIHVSDILGEGYSEAEIEMAERAVKKARGAVDVTGALKDARQAIKDADEKKRQQEREKFMRAYIVGKAKWDTKEVDPFGDSGERRYRNDFYGGEPATQKQVSLLRKLGVQFAESLTKRQASGLIGRTLQAKQKPRSAPLQSVGVVKAPPRPAKYGGAA